MVHICPRITKSHLVQQCKEVGLVFGDTVMVHASMRSVGQILGGPDVLIDAIMECVKPVGTMMMYIGCQPPFDDVGREIFNASYEAFILEHCPPFNVATARASRDFGILAEFFRTYPGVECSQNVCGRMAALGGKAHWMMDAQPLNYGFGKNSPLEKLCQVNGKILLIGSDLDQVTLLHYAEAIAPIPGKKIVRMKVPLDQAGKGQWLDVEDFNSSTGIRDWPDRFFAQIVEQFLSTSRTPQRRLGNANAYLFDANELVEFAVPIIIKTANEL